MTDALRERLIDEARKLHLLGLSNFEVAVQLTAVASADGHRLSVDEAERLTAACLGEGGCCGE
jgi:hypothetical protein